ncbi:hypothetical protein [Ochrobactrum sp. AN78]|uniref:hypothetical protein n=1 Tax=Ochrobactrum sp. AN78 TaxID=3039853 RepID=UPI002989CCA8|nr:hypothetical protein [Ochrobactrum sp. AN78]MDH7791651.1 hypothetical protein [Ochrobactrum sp. AN78]
MGETRSFDRWRPFDETTWSYQIFSRYDDQLGIIGTAHLNAMQFTFKGLKQKGVSWQVSAVNALDTGEKFLASFRTLKDWSDSYNLFDNWVNLNTVMACAANLETYVAAVVDLAIRSDPGLLFGASRSIDGAKLLKHGGASIETSQHVANCTKGDWSARFSALEKILGPLDPKIKCHHAKLEELRNIRNRVGHAFGRDIDNARNHGVRAFHDMESLSRERAYAFTRVCRTVARELDRHVLYRFIGDFETIRFFACYHRDVLNVNVIKRAIALKTALGRIGAQLRSKAHLAGLIEYWDAL